MNTSEKTAMEFLTHIVSNGLEIVAECNPRPTRRPWGSSSRRAPATKRTRSPA